MGSDDTSVRRPDVAAHAYVAGLAKGAPLDRTLRVTLNFHPDRLVGGVPILSGLAAAGVYLSQFVTRASNGGLTAYRGGDRWSWESRMFGCVYDEASPHERPVYGALNFRRKALGAAPRFGSAYLRLREQVLDRTTFCYPDSHLGPTRFGVAARMSLIEAALADDAAALDDYVEAQVHGAVRLDRDVEALVLDPSYGGSDVEAAALALPCAIEWHPGVRLSLVELRRHPEYRGPEYVELGAEIAVDGQLTPRIIGDAARTGRYDEQALKKVWHCVARFGD
jgi:hypothetical protein